MEELTSPTRRTLLTAAAASLATPVIGAAAQPAELRQEGGKFNLWVISDCHVGTDKAASEGILHGLVGFKPPPIYPETLAEALRQSENGGAFGGPPIPWDIALNLGDYAGFADKRSSITCSSRAAVPHVAEPAALASSWPKGNISKVGPDVSLMNSSGRPITLAYWEACGA